MLATLLGIRLLGRWIGKRWRLGRIIREAGVLPLRQQQPFKGRFGLAAGPLRRPSGDPPQIVHAVLALFGGPGKAPERRVFSTCSSRHRIRLTIVTIPTIEANTPSMAALVHTSRALLRNPVLSQRTAT
jgi:hypothetical protein